MVTLFYFRFIIIELNGVFLNKCKTVSSVSGNAGVVPAEALVSLRELFDLLLLFEDISAPGKECHVTYTSKSFSHKFKIFLGNDMYGFENVLEVVEELES